MARLCTLRNERTGAALATRVARASDPWTRGLGLLARAAVGADEGLWIAGCGAVHTVGMRAALDLYFLDRDDRVLRIARGVPPNRLVERCGGAKTVVELGVGDEREIAIGDRLALE